jgi:hypothetical protein
MLTPLLLTPIKVDRSKYLPPLLLELIEVAEKGGDLVPAVHAVVRKLGFEAFMYATARYHLRPSNGERIYVFTTLPREWVQRYDQQAYVECDPRVLCSFESGLPLVWDQASERGKNARTDAFLVDAAAHGVGSGVAFPVYDTYPARTLIALNFVEPYIDEARRAHIAENLGDIPATGGDLDVTATAIYRVTDGMLAEHWGETDSFALMQQLGVVPAPPLPAGAD